MHDELTRSDLEKMQEELDDRRINLRPKLLEAVKEARAFGDLSENFEYKAAKQEEESQRTAYPLSGEHDQDRRGHRGPVRGRPSGAVRPGDGLLLKRTTRRRPSSW